MFSLGGSTVTGVSGVSVIPVAMVVEPGDGSDTPVTVDPPTQNDPPSQPPQQYNPPSNPPSSGGGGGGY